MDIFWLNQNPVIDLKRGSSLRRRLNSLLLSLQMSMKTGRVYAYPRHLILDLYNGCQLKCPICPQGSGKINRKPLFIEANLFKNIINALGPYLYTLTLTNWGEPLRHPETVSLIRFARKFPVYIGFSSHLQHLPEGIIDDLLTSGIDEIGCSIDGATAETYSQYRVGGDYESAMANMIKLVSRKRELGLANPKIRWQILITRHTEKEIDQIIEKARDIGVDSLVFLPIYVDIAGMFTRSQHERFKRDREWLPENEELSWYDYSNGNFKKAPVFCQKLWDSLVVHPDGTISPCCAVIDPHDDFGSFFDRRSFWKVWNNENFISARKIITGKSGGRVRVVCAHCRNKGIVIY
jgi:MoaA/NifB/PqqE/SkfB family radical SAM enzyme